MNGQIKRIDELGRIVIPKDIRKRLSIRTNDSLEIGLDGDKIVLNKMVAIKEYNDYVKTLLEFVIDDDSTAYPNGAVHTDGYYYELLGQVSSANVMSLSDNALATVQQDYRDTIETEVSNANA